MRGLKRYRALALAYVSAVAAIALLAMLPGPALAGIVIGKAYPDGPAIILTPPEESTVTGAPAEPPPLPRAKPERKKVSEPKPVEQNAKAKKPAAKKAEQKKAPAKKAEQKKAPAKKTPAQAQAAPAQQSKTCDYCYGCLSGSHDCRRQWTCGKRYRDVVVLGLCRR